MVIKKALILQSVKWNTIFLCKGTVQIEWEQVKMGGIVKENKD